MRLFKYLVLIFFSIITTHLFAETDYYQIGTGSSFVKSTSMDSSCNSYLATLPTTSPNRKYIFKRTRINLFNSGRWDCIYDVQNPDNGGFYQNGVQATGDIVKGPDNDECPPTDYPDYFFYDAGKPIPKQTCREVGSSKFCVFIDKGNRIILNHKDNRQSVVLYSKSSKAFSSCTPLDEGQCDKNDPYGGCFTPPNDGCTRQKDGSIECPQDTPRPDPKSPCNGAAYCKRPPTGCGKGYVSGSFNGQQICVRAGPDSPKEPDEQEEPKKPNDPNDPNDPNKCTISSCPRPDTDKECPKGYYSTYHNGQAICVANNPDPNKPNPNDPNNKNPPDGGDGTDLSGVINAIRSLKDAMMGAFDTLTKKTSELITGQKDTNKHLDNLNKEAVKTNGKLDTSNEHLEKIEEATQATSEALGETNKKLSSVNDSVDGFYKCKNENYNLNDKSSEKFRQCTEQDLRNMGNAEGDTRVSVQEQSVDLDNDLRRDLFGSNSTCPPPLTIEFTFVAPVRLEFPFDLLCDGAALVRPWILLLGMLVSYFIVTGQRSGGQD